MLNYIKFGLSLVALIFITNFLNAQPITRFAVIGDYGYDGPNELAVANLVKGWNPDFIVTAGDNNYRYGAASTIDENIGKYYHDFIYPYIGTYGNGSPDSNRFFPVPGNHDWDTPNLQPYIEYFTLPNNERYYDFIWGDLHFFMIDSDANEPDGYNSSSTQAMWIKNKMENSTARWNIVVLHYSPYSSAQTHGSVTTVQWPFGQWGADAVFSGHDHTYERLIIDSLTYFVDGLGGKSLRIDDFPTDSAQWIPGSQVRYSSDYGAMLIEAYTDSLGCRFITKTGLVIDNYRILPHIIPVEFTSFTASLKGNSIILNWITATEMNNLGFEIERKVVGSQLTIGNYENIGFVSGNGTTTEKHFYQFIDESTTNGKLLYRLKQIDLDGSYYYSDAVEIDLKSPFNFKLSQNYPNPFNPSTKISWQTPVSGWQTLKVYNVLGKEVATLVDEYRESGSYEVEFKPAEGSLPTGQAGHQLASGVYFYRLQTGSYSESKKMILTK